ncbi:MAG: type I-E CRISPR-associated endonuclease Cas1 [Phycisphaerae bacterium]|nr:type I-E CRISPR-associated endonuclease Cas1 [Phycisphaerae bacterium]
MRNLHELPKFADKLGYLYVEHAVIDRDEKAIAVHDAEGTTQVPAASLALLLLGPGTKITHAAIQTLADNNCLAVWSGEYGVRFYAQGLGGARHSRNLIRQARLVSDERTRLQVVVRMYCLRFDEPVDPNLTLRQLRGKEGIRVRQAYAEAGKAAGIEWQGRSYHREQWNAADPVNRALSAANSCLYGLVHAAILSGGYSPALGFIHTGKQLSFVYDVADLYKAELTIPLAFRMAAEGDEQLERRVRLACRDRFHQDRLIERILPDVHRVLDVEEVQAGEDEFADDEAKPAGLWDPEEFSADTPIGTILKFRSTDLPAPDKEAAHDRDDSGTGSTVSSG